MTAIKFFNIFKIQILHSMLFPNAAFIFLLFFYACPSAFSQQKFTIHGTVNDKNSGEPLIGATVIVQRLNQGVITNDYGFYSLSLPKGSYSIAISYLGFETIHQSIALEDNQQLDFQLITNNNLLDEVVVTSTDSKSSALRTVLSGVDNLTQKEIKRIPPLLGEVDINRAILTQAGVTSIGEGTSGFNVRGGNIDQNLILLDEAPLYNASHLWGFFSAFNANAIKSMNLYKGNIPARFGGRASSVLDIRQREGNNQHLQGQGGLGILFSRLTLEGPIEKDKMSFLISGRRSFIDLLPDSITNLNGGKIYYYDLNTKLSWNIDSKNKLYLSGYFGADALKFGFDSEPNEEVGSVSEKVNFSWENATSTLRWNHIFGNRLFMNFSGIYSTYNYGLDSTINQGGAGIFNWDSEITTYLFKPDFTFYPSLGNTWQFGVHATYHKFMPAEIKSNEAGINDTNLPFEKGLEIAPYFEYEKKWECTTLLAGLRFSWFGNLGPNQVRFYNPDIAKQVNTVVQSKNYKKGEITKSYANIEPRISVKHQLNANQSIKFSFGKNIQNIHLLTNTTAALPFDVWKPSGEHVKPLKVYQTSLGYAAEHRSNKWQFTTDVFYKTFDNIIDYKNGADLFLNDRIETQILPAKGSAYGVELSFQKNKGLWTGEVNYTYSRALRKTVSPFERENLNFGGYFPSNYDRPHILNLILSKKLGEKWETNLAFTYQSGRPITAVIVQFKIEDRWLLTYSERNAYRLSDTHRLDLSFSYTPKKNDPNKKWKSTWNFGAYNLYRSKNSFSRFSKVDLETLDPKLRSYRFALLGSIIPFINYNFKF